MVLKDSDLNYYSAVLHLTPAHQQANQFKQPLYQRHSSQKQLEIQMSSMGIWHIKLEAKTERNFRKCQTKKWQHYKNNI